MTKMTMPQVLSRRRFAAVSLLAAAGCSSSPPAPPVATGPTLSDDDRARIERETAARKKLISDLDNYRSAANETRQTPAAAVDITETIPELKSRRKMSQRMHPRYGEEPPPDGSKFGGRFLWPADEPWPVDDATKLPLVNVLQLVGTDVWSRLGFRTGYDVLQLFWLPRDPVDGEYTAKVFWRNRGEVKTTRSEPPPLEMAYPSLVPVPCGLHPEWVMELPDWETLRRTELRAKMSEWKPPEGDAKSYYDTFLSSARGSKAGGWPRAGLANSACKKCQWPMDYLLTIDSVEWAPTEAIRWRPVQDADDAIGRRAATGLSFVGGRAVEVYLCRKCDPWTARAVVVG